MKYGLTEEAYADMLASQGGVCAICKRLNRQEDRTLAVDHCHVTGVVRAILCDGCNGGLGLLDDSEERLEAALAYLRHHHRIRETS